MNDKTTIDVKTLPVITKFIYTIGELPTSYLMSMSYMEQVVWLCNYLEQTIIPALNQNGEAVQELQTLYELLRQYVNDYFDNLDVQEEINNKLDDMVEAGTLQEIIAEYLNSKAVFGFDNVESMKEATNLIDGSYAKTLGYYDVNDNGEALYKITEEQPLTYYETLNNGLYAQIIKEEIMNPLQFGCKGDNETDDSIQFLNCIKSFENIKIDLLNKNYNLSTLSSFTFNKNTTLKNGTLNIDNIIMRNSDGVLKIENVEIITTSLVDYGSSQKFIIFADNNDTGSFIIKNSKLISNKTENITNQICLIYLKDYNYVEIENCVIENNNENSDVGGCIWISNKSQTSNYVKINNNIIKNTSKDECVGLYDTYSNNYLEMSNNYIEQTYPSTYANTLYGHNAIKSDIINNTFKSPTTEFAVYSISTTNLINFNNNIMIHDASQQTENNKSGLYIGSSSININCDKNIFNAINCESANHTIVSHNAGGHIINNWHITFDSNSTYNSNGSCAKICNSVFNELYAVIRKMENCIVNSTTSKMTSNLEATNCTFNITNGVTGGYAANNVIFKNCVGGAFYNSTKTANLIIENSSVNYYYGENLVNNQSRLNSAGTSGHIYFSIMENAVVDNLIVS